LSLVIRPSRSNFFISIIKSKTGELVKSFSAGKLKIKTTKKKRAIQSFVRLLQLVVEYLQRQHIFSLGTLYFKLSYISPYIRFSQFLIKKIVRFFKDHKFKIKRWLFNIRRSHASALRLPKIRRK
jgi:hypothetical protein